MCQAIVSGLIQQPTFDITVVERGEATRAHLQDAFGVTVSDTMPALTSEDVLLLAVKPQDMAAALQHIDTNGALVLSIAAGLDTQTLSQLTNNTRVIRIMPNTPAQVGLGVAGLYAAADISEQDKAIAQNIMQSVGAVYWLQDEAQMHAITGVSGSGPAYVFYLLQALASAAQAQGFDEQTANELSLATFKGAIALAEQSGLPFSQLQQNVTSKGGTTFAAITAFEQAHVAQGIAQGVAACVARSEQMQQQWSPK